MSVHVHANLLTHHGVAANNRGETEANALSTLQKTCWRGINHTTVSAEAIRAAIRALLSYEDKNRVETPDGGFTYKDETFATPFFDDIAMGYMATAARKYEGDEESAAPETDKGKNGKGKNGKGKKITKGTAKALRGLFEANRMVSLDAWRGDTSFNTGRKGSNLGSKTPEHNNVFSCEFHSTRYQWPFSLTPEAFPSMYHAKVPGFLRTVMGTSRVAGNHSRYHFDYSPESVVFRVTHESAPKIQYCFEERDGVVYAPELIQAVELGDIPADSLIIGGLLAVSPDGKRLAELGAVIPNPAGVMPATEAMIKKVVKSCGWNIE